MEFALTSFFLILFILIIYKSAFFDLPGISRKITVAAFGLKASFSFVIWAIYTFYYTDRSTSDIFKYFDDGKILHGLFYESPLNYFKVVFGIDTSSADIKSHLEKLNFWYKTHNYGIFNDNRTIIRFNSLVNLFSMGYYHIHSLTMCFLSFIGLTALYKVFIPHLKNKSKELFFAVFLLPSVLFWGSGVLKEGLLIFSLGCLIYQFMKILDNQFNTLRLLWIFSLLGLLFITKVYLLLMILPGLIALLVIKFTGTKKAGLKFILVHFLLIAMALNWKLILRLPGGELTGTEVVTGKSLDLLNMLKYKQKDFIHEAKIEKAGSYIELGELDNTLSSFIANTPRGISNVLFRPHLLDSRSPIVLLAALENLIFIFLIILAFLFFKKPTEQEKPILYFSISFVILLALLIGLVVPVLGAIVRYKVPMLPFYAIIFLTLIDKEKLITKLPFLKFIR